MNRIFPFLLLVFACSQDSNDSSINMGEVSEQLAEASALVASEANPGYLWTLNDSGNLPEVYLIDSFAQTKLVYKLQNATNRDWEDMAIGVGPDSTKKYLYVAEIGDNLSVFPFKYLYRFPEPAIGDSTRQSISNIEKIVIKMPDGIRDSETIMIDPITNDFYIVSKREENVNIYFSKYPFASDTLKPLKVLTIPLTHIVSGSISYDGQQVLMKNYEKIYYWKRRGEKSLIELLARAPEELPYNRESQGEAICWNNNATGFYTLSESPKIGSKSQLRFYKRR